MSKAADRRMPSLAAPESLGSPQALHTPSHLIQLGAAQGKQRCQREHYGRRLPTQREMNPLQLDVEILLEVFNTPGTEITPRSNKIDEDFNRLWFRHIGNVKLDNWTGPI